MSTRTRGEAAPMTPTGRTAMALRGDRELVTARTFAGPARLVFEAWTRRELVRRWWAPRSCTGAQGDREADVRVGGRYRYVLRLDPGAELAFSGTYVEVTPHARLVHAQPFEPMADGGAALITVTFGERDGRTHMVARERDPSAESRDAALASGMMEEGMRETMDQLDELVASLA